MLGDTELPIRAHIEIRLASMLVGTNDALEGFALAEQALGRARRESDPETLSFILFFAIAAVFRECDRLDERLALSDELLRLAAAHGERQWAFDARLERFRIQLERADADGMEQELRICESLALELPASSNASQVLTDARAMLASLRGQFDESERLARRVLIESTRRGAKYSPIQAGILLFTTRRHQGRLSELEPTLRQIINGTPGLSDWRWILAVADMDLGREDDARRELALIDLDVLSTSIRDAGWLFSVLHLAEVVAFLGDADRAARLYALALPYALRTGVWSAVCLGAVARYLGLLATTMRRWDVAELHFENALTINSRIQAQPYAASCQYEHAAMLIKRNAPGDRANAAERIEASTATATAIHQFGLVAKLETLRQTL